MEWRVGVRDERQDRKLCVLHGRAASSDNYFPAFLEIVKVTFEITQSCKEINGIPVGPFNICVRLSSFQLIHNAQQDKNTDTMDPSRKRSSAPDLPLLVAKAKRKRPNDNQISSKARLYSHHPHTHSYCCHQPLDLITLLLPRAFLFSNA